MKVGLVGFQDGGKSTLFQLLTGATPDPAKVHFGQIGVADVPDERLDRLVKLWQPRTSTAARIELFDTPGLSRNDASANATRLAILRDVAALVQVVGVFRGVDPAADVATFVEQLVLADLSVVSRRIKRLRTDITKALPNRAELREEVAALEPLQAPLAAGRSLRDVEFTAAQEAAARSFALLTRKPMLVVLNTLEAHVEEPSWAAIEADALPVVAAPIGLELELAQLDASDRADFAVEMGIREPSRDRLLRSIFQTAGQITFFTHNEREVRAWPLTRGETAVEAAASIHTDLAKGFIRVEVMAADDLLRLGSERLVKAAGLHRVEGREYVVQDGDELFIRSGI